MEKNKQRFNTNLPQALIEEIDQYKKDHYLTSRNAAIILLTDKALKQEGYGITAKESAK